MAGAKLEGFRGPVGLLPNQSGDGVLNPSGHGETFSVLLGLRDREALKGARTLLERDAFTKGPLAFFFNRMIVQKNF